MNTDNNTEEKKAVKTPNFMPFSKNIYYGAWVFVVLLLLGSISYLIIEPKVSSYSSSEKREKMVVTTKLSALRPPEITCPVKYSPDGLVEVDSVTLIFDKTESEELDLRYLGIGACQYFFVSPKQIYPDVEICFSGEPCRLLSDGVFSKTPIIRFKGPVGGKVSVYTLPE